MLGEHINHRYYQLYHDQADTLSQLHEMASQSPRPPTTAAEPIREETRGPNI